MTINRFKNYLADKTLTKQYLVLANEQIRKNQHGAALMNLSNAVFYLLTAMNNLASLHFEKRRKR